MLVTVGRSSPQQTPVPTLPGAELPSAVSETAQSTEVALLQAGSRRQITAAQGAYDK